jgi:hypothetical protein
MTKKIAVDSSKIVFQGKEIEWGKIEKIDVLTTDDGPFVQDIFWVISSSAGKSKLVLPMNDAVEGHQELMKQIFKLPSFDYKTFITATGSTSKKIFSVWSSKIKATSKL